jgi:predicted nucleotidyltransferase
MTRDRHLLAAVSALEHDLNIDKGRDICTIVEMQLQRPIGVIAPSVSADVLAVLAHADAAFTPPEVHRLLGAHSVDGVRRALAALTAQGIVIGQRSGQAVRYELNRHHLAAPYIVALAALRDELLMRLTERIEAWESPCLYAALFGSAARNDMRLESDIDLFVVRPDVIDPDDAGWLSQIDTLEADTARWTGNDVRTLHYSEEELRTGLLAGDRVLDDIRDEGIRLTGPASLLRQVGATT